MLCRIALLVLLSAPVVRASTAQITLTRNNFPFAPGTSNYSAYSSDNEDGANTGAIETLIAQTGADMTFDFGALQYDFTMTGEHSFTVGATGPGAEIELFSGASHTAVLPFRTMEEDMLVEGIIHVYLNLSNDYVLDLGGYMVGEYDGVAAEVSTTRLPGGDTTAVF